MINISDRPWINPIAADKIEQYLRGIGKTPDVFEWGSGGSTMWFCRQGANVVTVEHDREWADAVAAAKTINDNLLLTVISVRDPNYWSFINKMTRKYHLVMVDGRNREQCIRNAIPKVLPGGLLVLDDSQRRRYRTAVLLADRSCKDKLKLVEEGGREITLWTMK